MLAQLASLAKGARLQEVLELLERICRRLGVEEGRYVKCICFCVCIFIQRPDIAVLYTREDFDWQRAAVLGVIRCLRVNFQVGVHILNTFTNTNDDTTTCRATVP